MTENTDAKPSIHWKKMLLTGIFVLFPLAVTVWLLVFLIQKISGMPWVNWFVDQVLQLAGVGKKPGIYDWIVNSVSLFLVLFMVMLIGWLANFYIGKKVLTIVDRVMLRLPFVRGIYGGTKQVIDAFSMQRGSGSFKKVVLLEYPRKESWVLGFVTNENLAKAQSIFGRSLIAVFVPSTPNPTTGFLLYLSPFDLYRVDLEVDEAVKLIVSAGLVLPEKIKKSPTNLGVELGLTPPEPEPARVR